MTRTRMTAAVIGVAALLAALLSIVADAPPAGADPSAAGAGHPGPWPHRQSGYRLTR